MGEGLEAEDAGSDGVGDLLPQRDRSHEFGDGGETAGLREGEGLGADARGVRVGDIVGSERPDADAEGEDADGEEPVEAVERAGHDGQEAGRREVLRWMGRSRDDGRGRMSGSAYL